MKFNPEKDTERNVAASFTDPENIITPKSKNDILSKTISHTSLSEEIENNSEIVQDVKDKFETTINNTSAIPGDYLNEMNSIYDSKDNNVKTKTIPYESQNKVIDPKVSQKIEGGTGYHLDDGRPVQILSRISGGGEGDIYRTDMQGVVAKLYNERHLKGREEKIRFMTSKGLKMETICWPMASVYKDDGSFAGFVMIDAGNRLEIKTSVFDISNETTKRKYFPDWTRKELVDTCLGVLSCFKQLHENGILMGDVNASNMMVSADKAKDVYFVDCDSYGYGDFRCTVGVSEYTSPAIIRNYGHTPDFSKVERTEKDEAFAICVILFQILMAGRLPFSVSGAATSIPDAIRKHMFLYGRKGSDINKFANMADAHLPKYIKNVFSDAFCDEKYPTDEEWIKLLSKYKKQMIQGHFSSEISPMVFPGSEEKIFTCTYCGKKSVKPLEEYEKIKKNEAEKQRRNPGYKEDILCPDCLELFRNLRMERGICECVRCGKEFETDGLSVLRVSRYGWKFLCPECKKRKNERYR